MNEHPSVDIVGSLSQSLAGKTIVLGVTGSVAAVRSVDLARLLMRHGAQVYPVMSHAATQLVHPNLLEWATGHKPITELTGQIEHVSLVGNVKVHADLLLIAPATANTVGKIASGIDDTPVTTFVTTAFGEGLPVLVVPAMHQSMYAHPFVVANLARLEGAGIRVLGPRVEEGKAKIADNDEILQAVREALVPASGKLAGQTVIITAGRTVEYLDPIRVVTNNSTGRMGLALAEAALRLGARVIVVSGKLSVPVPPGVELVVAETSAAMEAACRKLVEAERPRVFIACAAVGDWTPVAPSATKLPTSSGNLVVEFRPTPKIVDQVKGWNKATYLVVFRAQSGLSEADLLTDATSRLAQAGGDLIAANDDSKPGEGFGTDTNSLLVVDAKGNHERLDKASKAEVARKLLAKIELNL
ncbi:MAG: bifunctional phosphopantothenoylcysteine decarboxylase/phosphopantothenate--cysteine ligase CoaBC [Spirochaetales bacterium]